MLQMLQVIWNIYAFSLRQLISVFWGFASLSLHDLSVNELKNSEHKKNYDRDRV